MTRHDNIVDKQRSSREQKRIIEDVFGNFVAERCSEILYSPELHYRVPGNEGSMLGKLDSMISNNFGFLGWFARQHSFHCEKL